MSSEITDLWSSELHVNNGGQEVDWKLTGSGAVDIVRRCTCMSCEGFIMHLFPIVSGQYPGRRTNTVCTSLFMNIYYVYYVVFDIFRILLFSF